MGWVDTIVYVTAGSNCENSSTVAGNSSSKHESMAASLMWPVRSPRSASSSVRMT